MMVGHGYGMGWGMWLMMGLGMLTFWIMVFLLVRALNPGFGRTTSETLRPDPLTVLKERLVRGEVTPEEYEVRRRLILEGP